MPRSFSLPPIVVDDDDPRPAAYYLARRLGVRQADIAALAGVTEPYVNHIFTGYRRPTQKVIDATVKALGDQFTAEQLFEVPA